MSLAASYLRVMLFDELCEGTILFHSKKYLEFFCGESISLRDGKVGDGLVIRLNISRIFREFFDELGESHLRLELIDIVRSGFI